MANIADMTTTAFQRARLFGERIRSHVLLIAVTAFLVFLIAVPLIRLVASSFQLGHPSIPEGWSLQNYTAAFSMGRFYSALATTVVVSAVGTFITMAIAILFAWLIDRTDMPFRNLAWVLILIPMAMPGILFAMGWVLLLAPKTGALNIGIRGIFESIGIHFTEGPLNIYSYGGLIFLDGLRGVTTVFLMIVGAFRMMDPSLEEAARVSKAGARGTFFQITLPVLMPAVLMAGMYSFISSMDSLEAPLAVGLPAGIFLLSTLIYFTTRVQTPTDYGLGATFGVFYMILMIGLLILYRRAIGYSARFATVTGKGYRPRVNALGKWRYLAVGMFVLYFLLTVVAPFAILLWASLLPSYRLPSWEAFKFISLLNYEDIFSDPHNLSVVWNTFLLVLLTATATMLLAFMVSWVVVRSRVPGRSILDGFLFLPHAIPGVVIALALMMAYLTYPLNQLGIYGSIWLVVFGLIASYIAFGSRLMNSGITQIHAELEEAAYMSRASVTRTLFSITLPLLFPVFAAGWVWVAVHALRAFSIPLMLSSKQNEVLAVSLWAYWDEGEASRAAALGVLLMLFLIPLTLLMRRFIVRFSGRDS